MRIPMQANTVKELGAALREARVARGETQRELATRIHVTQSAISKIEKGYAGATIGLIFQLLKALGLPLHVGSARVAPSPTSRRADADEVDLDAIANTGLKRK
jgi:HTH-type transcriptional regulator / antitoxin HipB